MKAIFLVFICLFSTTVGFIPAKVMESVIYKLTSEFDSSLGKVSESLVHDEIMKRGLIQSVVKYFHEQPSGSQRVDLAKVEDYYDLRKLYYDYYGKVKQIFKINFLSQLYDLIISKKERDCVMTRSHFMN